MRRARSSRPSRAASSRDLRHDLGVGRTVTGALLAARLVLRRELVRGEATERLADLRGVVVVDLRLDRLRVRGAEGLDRLALDLDDIRIECIAIRLRLIGGEALRRRCIDERLGEPVVDLTDTER